MTTASKPPVLVVLQLTGGNDYMNTVIPYTDQNYYDGRAKLAIDRESVLKVDDELGFHPNMAPVRDLYEQGDVAVIHGVGYENSPRSHFRSMDIWHTCEPDKIGTEGWVGRAIRDLDPQNENPVTGVSIGQGLPRATLVPGVSVASVAAADRSRWCHHCHPDRVCRLPWTQDPGNECAGELYRRWPNGRKRD